MKNFSHRFSAAIAATTVMSALLTGCSMDIVPVHSSRVKSAKYAEQPLLRGPNAPGAYQFSWNFTQGPKGYLFDPSEIEIKDGILRFKPSVQNGRKEAIVVTQAAVPFAALDSLTETPGPGNQGKISYQLSRDNSSWFYHNGKSWIPGGANASMANSAEQVTKQIGTFHSEVGTGELYLKIFLTSPTGKEIVELKEVKIQGISPRVDGWD